MSDHRLLELLATDASREQLDQAVLALGVAREEADLARRVRATLDQRSRREAELAALVDTARDLAALRDLDAVLVAIVRRARALLGTDTAYLTLVDEERGDTVMRVTDGSVSARFQALRLPFGAGLGGLVAQRAAPYATADYLADDRFNHTSEIDTGVVDEGLVAILGVPLKLGSPGPGASSRGAGSRVIGVLFAANRRRRPFAREEVDLLSSLAALAAVAIDNARLLAETRQAVADARAANAVASRRNADVERAAAAHERMTALVLHGGDVGDLAAAVVDVLGGGLVVLDADERVLAAVGPEPAFDVATAVRPGVGPGHASAVAAVHAGGGDPLAHLVLHGRPAAQGADRRILERAAQVTALLLLLRSARAEAENRLRGEVLTDLIDTPDRLRDRPLPIDVAAPHAVVVVSADGVGRHRLASAAAAFASERGGLAGEYRGAVVLVLPCDDAADADAAADGADATVVSGGAGATAAATAARDRLATAVRATVTAGAGGPARDPAVIAAAYREARRCLDALHALGRLGDAAGPADLGFAGLLLADADATAVDAFVRSTLGPVLDYDARRGTDLVATLRAFFANDRSPARCAPALHVHVNTVTQRLDRVRRLLGDGWSEPDRAMQLQLALHVHRLRC